MLETELLLGVPIVVSYGETTTPWEHDLQPVATGETPNKCVLICFNYLVDFCKRLKNLRGTREFGVGEARTIRAYSKSEHGRIGAPADLR